MSKTGGDKMVPGKLYEFISESPMAAFANTDFLHCDTVMINPGDVVMLIEYEENIKASWGELIDLYWFLIGERKLCWWAAHEPLLSTNRKFVGPERIQHSFRGPL